MTERPRKEVPHLPVRMFCQNFRTRKCGTSLCGCSVRISAQESAEPPRADVLSEIPHKEVRNLSARMFCQNVTYQIGLSTNYGTCQQMLSAYQGARQGPIKSILDKFITSRTCLQQHVFLLSYRTFKSSIISLIPGAPHSETWVWDAVSVQNK